MADDFAELALGHQQARAAQLRLANVRLGYVLREPLGWVTPIPSSKRLHDRTCGSLP